MKYFFKILFLFFFISSCKTNFDGSIGKEISSGNFELNKEVKDSIISDWNQALKMNQINSVISELQVLKENDRGTIISYYSILGITNNDSAKIRMEIEIKNQNLYFLQNDVTNIVICHGSDDCYPRLANGKWFCDDANNKESCSKNCQKTEISSINE